MITPNDNAKRNYERVKRWREKHRGLVNLKQREYRKRKNLSVPVLAGSESEGTVERRLKASTSEAVEASSEARESNMDYAVGRGESHGSDSRGGQIFETKKVGEFRMLVVPPKDVEERAEMPVVKPKVFFNDHGAQISEKVWNALQEKKRKANEAGYEFDPQ